MFASSRLLLLILLHLASAGAFVASPRALANTRLVADVHQQVREKGDSSLFLFPPSPMAAASSSSSLMFADDADMMIDAISSNPIFEGIKTILVILTAGAFLLFGLSYITAAVIIPKAAEQLEREAQELAPELWQEYQAKLGPGETMATRPDLLQELGNKVQPLIEQKMMREAAAQQQGGMPPQEPPVESSSAPSSSPPRQTTGAIDVEIIAVEPNEEPKQS